MSDAVVTNQFQPERENSTGSRRPACVFRFGAWILSVWLIVDSLNCLEVKGVEFSVSGRIEQQNKLGVQGAETSDFEVFLRGNDWLIKIRQLSFAPEYTNVMLLDYVCYNQGDCIYTYARAREYDKILSRLLTDPKSPAGWKSHPGNVPIDMAWIEKGSVPRADNRFALPLIFYAYCSRSYIGAFNNHSLEPPFFVDGRPNSFEKGQTNVPAFVSLSKSLPFLPEQISFMHGNKMLLESGATIHLPKEWESFTNAVYKVDSFTNIGSIKLPERFALTVFQAQQNAEGKPLIVRTSASVTVHASFFSDTCDVEPKDMKPEMLAFAKVTDKRVVFEGLFLSVRYNTNKWLSEETVANLKECKAAVFEMQAEIADRKSVNPHSRNLVIIILGLSSMLLIGIWLAVRSNNTRAKGNN